MRAHVCLRKRLSCDKRPACSPLFALCTFLILCVCTRGMLMPPHRCVCVCVCPVGVAAVRWQPLHTLHCLLRRPLRCPLLPTHAHTHTQKTHSTLLPLLPPFIPKARPPVCQPNDGRPALKSGQAEQPPLVRHLTPWRGARCLQHPRLPDTLGFQKIKQHCL